MKHERLLIATGKLIFLSSVLCFALLCLWPGAALSQSRNAANTIGNCTVRILDAGGNPVSGAAVVVKGSNRGEISDTKGICRFHAIPAHAVLTVSYLGMTARETPLNGRTEITITLTEESLQMDELVVVGYGVQRKRDLSGAIAQVKGDVINEFANLSIASALQGRVSGVQINQLNGQPGAGIQVRIRGANSIKGDNEPLWIINGFPGDINMINTSDIESVEILKDASATAIYGSRGANGVVIVTTKSAKQGEVKVTYDGSVGVQSLAKQMEMLSGDEYMIYLNKKAEINGLPDVFTEKQIQENTFNTNWQDEVFRAAVITNHAVDITGGFAFDKQRLESTLCNAAVNIKIICQPDGILAGVSISYITHNRCYCLYVQYRVCLCQHYGNGVVNARVSIYDNRSFNHFCLLISNFCTHL